MSIVTKTGIVVPIDSVQKRRTHFSNTCLDVATTGDKMGPISFKWGVSNSGWTIFFQALIRSTPSGASRLIDGDGTQSVILSVTGYLVTNSGSGVTEGTTSGQLELNVWHKYALTWELGKRANTGLVRAYRDNNLFNQMYLPTAPSAATFSNYFFNRSDGVRQCDMKVKEMEFYSRTFAPKDVIAHYYGKSFVSDSTLEVYYKLDEGSGQVAHDSSPHARHATISGCTWSTSPDTNL